MRVGKYRQRSYFRRSKPKMSQNWRRMQTRRHSGRKIYQLQSRWWTSVKTEFLHIFQDLDHECETSSYKRRSKRSADRDLILMNYKNLWVTTAEDARLCKWLIWGLRMKWLTLSRTLSEERKRNERKRSIEASRRSITRSYSEALLSETRLQLVKTLFKETDCKWNADDGTTGTPGKNFGKMRANEQYHCSFSKKKEYGDKIADRKINASLLGLHKLPSLDTRVPPIPQRLSTDWDSWKLKRRLGEDPKQKSLSSNRRSQSRGSQV
jgi:hypothetical protein